MPYSEQNKHLRPLGTPFLCNFPTSEQNGIGKLNDRSIELRSLGWERMAEGEEMLVVQRDVHDAIFTAAFLARGFDEIEAAAAVEMAALASQHGVR